MKKFLILMMAVAVVAVAGPALAQLNLAVIATDANDVNDNGTAIGNTAGVANNNEQQFINSTIGDQSGSGSFMNKSLIAVDGLGSGNVTNVDASVDGSSAGLLNKSNVLVAGTGNDNTLVVDGSGAGSLLNKSTVNLNNIGNNNTAAIGGTNAEITLLAVDSLNNNKVLVGDMANAHQFEYESAHQFEHQLNFPATFSGMADSMAFMPLTPVHLQQANTGISSGDAAGAVNGGGSISQINMSGATIAGMAGGAVNVGGVAQNQAAANVVTAFSR